MSAYTDKVRLCTLVVYWPLEVVVGALKKAHISPLWEKKKRKIEQWLLVSGGGLALARSYSERWQVVRIGLCGRGAVCGALKMLNCH